MKLPAKCTEAQLECSTFKCFWWIFWNRNILAASGLFSHVSYNSYSISHHTEIGRTSLSTVFRCSMCIINILINSINHILHYSLGWGSFKLTPNDMMLFGLLEHDITTYLPQRGEVFYFYCRPIIYVSKCFIKKTIRALQRIKQKWLFGGFNNSKLNNFRKHL